MGRDQIEKRTIPSLEGYTRVYYCPANGKLDVDIMFSTIKPLGEDSVGETKDIPCRYGIKDRVHMDRSAMVAVPISAVVDRTVKTVALAKAKKIFTPPQPSPQ